MKGKFLCQGNFKSKILCILQTIDQVMEHDNFFLINRPHFLLTSPVGRPFSADFRQTYPARPRLNVQSVTIGCNHPRNIRGRDRDNRSWEAVESVHP